LANFDNNVVAIVVTAVDFVADVAVVVQVLTMGFKTLLEVFLAIFVVFFAISSKKKKFSHVCHVLKTNDGSNNLQLEFKTLKKF
jgi:hypothetical protein